MKLWFVENDLLHVKKYEVFLNSGVQPYIIQYIKNQWITSKVVGLNAFYLLMLLNIPANG